MGVASRFIHLTYNPTENTVFIKARFITYINTFRRFQDHEMHLLSLKCTTINVQR